MRLTLTIIGAAILAAPAICRAGDEQTPRLSIGDKAPQIDVAHWLKGDGVGEFENGKIYVVEFWATWCGPCKASIPHLGEVQEKFADYDVTVIGVSDEDLQTVVKFLGQTDKKSEELWFNRVHYTLATDPDESTHTSYMKAAGQRGIPTAFVVGKDGRIEWVGHPMRMDEVLEAVAKDTWNRARFKRVFDLRREAGDAQQAQNYQRVLEILDELAELDPPMRNYYQNQRFTLLLTAVDRPKDAYAIGRELVQTHWDNAQQLNAIAWMVVDHPAVKTRDLQFAMKAAMRANELTDGEDAPILDTVARVYYEKGELSEAIKWQRKAVEHAAEGTPMEQSIRKTLEKYESQAGEEM